MWTIGQVSRQRELLVQRPHGRLRCEDERSSNEARRLEWSGLKEMVGEEVGGKMGPPSQGLDVLSHFNLGRESGALSPQRAVGSTAGLGWIPGQELHPTCRN